MWEKPQETIANSFLSELHGAKLQKKCFFLFIFVNILYFCNENKLR